MAKNKNVFFDLPGVWYWEGDPMGSVPVVLAWTLIVTLALCGVWDVIKEVFQLEAPSVSQQFAIVIYEHPIIALLTGLLLGHLFWQRR